MCGSCPCPCWARAFLWLPDAWVSYKKSTHDEGNISAKKSASAQLCVCVHLYTLFKQETGSRSHSLDLGGDGVAENKEKKGNENKNDDEFGLHIHKEKTEQGRIRQIAKGQNSKVTKRARNWRSIKRKKKKWNSDMCHAPIEVRGARPETSTNNHSPKAVLVCARVCCNSSRVLMLEEKKRRARSPRLNKNISKFKLVPRRNDHISFSKCQRHSKYDINTTRCVAVQSRTQNSHS